MRLPKDKEQSVQKTLEKCRKEYIHGIMINEELVFPSLEQLVTRYKGQISMNRLLNTSRKEAWKDKRKLYEIPAADIVVKDDLDKVDDVDGYAKEIMKMLLSELSLVEKARIQQKRRRTPKELGELGKFVKTAMDIAHHDRASSGDNSIMINIQNIVQDFKRNYGKSIELTDDARAILEESDIEEKDDLAGQIRMLEEEEGII
jgi:hypothetical protein